MSSDSKDEEGLLELQSDSDSSEINFDHKDYKAQLAIMSFVV